MISRLDEEFGPGLRYDFFRPEGEGPFPLLVFIHGGGWISGDKSDFRDEALWFTEQGFATACIQYRLAPVHPFPAAIVDCQRFVQFARQESREFGIDPDRLGAFGSSAGGYLATMLGLLGEPIRPTGLGADPRVQAVVDFCGITDLTHPRERHFPIAWSFLEAYVGGPWSECPERWEEASPIRYVDAGAAPFAIFHGLEDDVVPIEQSRELAARLRDAGVPVELHEFPGEGHGFSWPSYLRAREIALRFLRTHLNRETS